MSRPKKPRPVAEASARLAQIDAVDKIQPAVQQDHDIGLQPVIQLVLQAHELLPGGDGLDPGVVDDIAMGRIEGVQALRQQAGQSQVVRHLGAVDLGSAEEKHGEDGLAAGRRIGGTPVMGTRRRQRLDVEIDPLAQGLPEQPVIGSGVQEVVQYIFGPRNPARYRAGRATPGSG